MELIVPDKLIGQGLEDEERAELVKEPGTQSFVPNTAAVEKEKSSEQLALTFRNTEQSLRNSIEEALKTGSSAEATKIEKDLADFYDSISRKYGTAITKRQDFLDLMDSLEGFDNKVAQAQELVDGDLNRLLEENESKKDVKTNDEHIKKMFKGNSYQGLDTQKILNSAKDRRRFKRNSKKRFTDDRPGKDTFNNPKERLNTSNDGDSVSNNNGDSYGHTKQESDNRVTDLIKNGMD